MKKLFSILFVILVLFLSAFALSSCNVQPNDENKSTATERVRGDVVDEKNITYSKLGLFAETITSSDEYVADAIPSSRGDYLVVRAYENGTAVLTVKDYWGYEAEVTVTVEDNFVKKAEVTKKFSQDNVINVRLYGATGNGTTDDTAIIQSASDALKGKKDAVLLFPKGTYRIGRLILWGDITVDLYGRTENVKDGYTDAVKKKVDSGQYAVLLNDYSTNVIMNHDPSGSGTLGTSNITIRGGVIDMNGALSTKKQIDTDWEYNKVTNTCAICFSCGDNVVFENTIYKDMYNAHAMQICAMTNVVIKDCMFAGYVCRPDTKGDDSSICLTRETLQIEYAHSGAIPPSSFEAGEFYWSSNVTVTGCYFGDSDEAGYQMTPIGNHGANGYANCDGMTVTDNVFDNPYCYGLNLTNYSNVTLKNNVFISSTVGFRSQNYFIYITLKMSNSTYTDKYGNFTSAFLSNENQGCHNIDISNNTFTIDGKSNKRVMWAVSVTNFTPGATTVSSVSRQKRGTFVADTYTGFIKNTNFLENLSFVNNTISCATTSYNNFFVNVNGGANVVLKNNNVSLSNGAKMSQLYNDQAGFNVSNLMLASLANSITITTNLTGKTISLPKTSGTMLIRSANTSTHKLTLKTYDEHIHIDYSVNEANGNLIVTVTWDDGYVFDGWTIKSGSFSMAASTYALTDDVVLEAKAIKK